MEQVYVQHGRAEQLVSVARVPLAVMSVVILAIDPGAAALPRAPLVLAAAVYAAWAIAVAVRVARSSVHSRLARLGTHVVDLAAATLLIGGTQTPVSALFPLYIVTLFSAAVRFDVRGVHVTGVAILCLYAGMSLLSGAIRVDPSFVATRMIHLAVATLLLGFLRRNQDQMREDLTRLAAWPRRAFDEREPLVRSALEKAGAILHAPRIAAVFEEEDEPWLWIATREASRFELAREAPGHPILGAAPADSTFFCADAAAPHPVMVLAVEGRTERLPGAPLSDELRTRLAARSVLSAPFSGETVTGRLFVLDRSGVTIDEMMLSRIVAQLFAARLDEFAFFAAARGAAIGEERLRLARNLHDTLLQSLTAVGFQVENALELLERDPEEARRKMQAVQELIARVHDELRADIARLRPRGGTTPAPTLARRLGELPLWAFQQWDVIVAVEVDPPEADVPEPLATEIFRLVNEAVSNAARHAGGSLIRTCVALDATRASIVVSDDGRGLPFHGTFDLAELEARNRGPLTLRERVSALGGTLVLHSSERGTTVEMTVPLQALSAVARSS